MIMCFDFLFSQLQTYKMIILRAVKEDTSCTSVKQSFFKQFVTGDTVVPYFIILVKKLLCLCTVGFCDQASSWSSSLEWTEEHCNQQPSLVDDWSCVLWSAQFVSHVLGSYVSKGEIITTEQIQLDIGVRV